ncbi:M10 family metallopeptidase C-terminal domain-containing protein [Caulobacter sp. 17J80-11]|uniref:M10 family metallopeptidase C-terminal domain-containing protein n=1 Tax=Caulobacter sp. 17J80-11 TaxID=2763502 RepID=UPI00165384D8|nr:M10 family metallopeptidase C-terminal domain-containing protein [Caulobacter sp. 17J80-11]MBC6981709.1 M10 family metallopeptidase C-terminal domain-containing protein [Caulobacter sp. 17J80-11]
MGQFDSIAWAESAAAAAGAAPGEKPVFNLNQVIANFERWGISWGPGAVVPYAFLTAVPSALGGDPDYAGFQALSDIEQGFVRMAFQMIADVANISFVEVPDNGSFFGRLTFGSSSTMPDFVWGWADVRDAGTSVLASSIWLNTETVGTRSWVVGGYNFMATMHEIMHGLGFPHPGEYNADGSDITYAADAEYFQDSRQYTVMSYFAAAETGAFHMRSGLTYSGATLLLHDIAAIQAVYGANTTTRTGDTVYGYHSTAGLVSYDFSANTNPIVCIWDAGGIDTIDLSGSATAINLDLNEGAFSDVCGFTDNLSIAYGAQVENGIGSALADFILGNALNNQLSGGAGDDQLTGGAGDDVLIGGTGADTMLGGAGDDLYEVENFGDVAVEQAGGGVDTVRASLTHVLGANVENLVLIGTALNGTGNGLSNALTGNALNNSLDGATGDDVLEGGLGDDVLVGGTGTDTASYAGASGAVTASLTAGTASGAAGTDTFSSIENLTGSGFADSLRGDANANVLNGGGGNDLLDGGAGNDTLVGGSGNDTATYANTTGGVGVSVDLSLAGAQATIAAGLDALAEIENLIGSSYADTLKGDAGANILTGGAGADVLDGRGGDDKLDGGTGVDTADYSSATAGVTLNLNDMGQAQNTGAAGIDTPKSIENINGSAFNDNLRGHAGTNYLYGGGGDDVLEGGGGHDHLIGGAGIDTASYVNSAAAVTVRLTTTDAQVTGGAGSDTLTEIENLTGSRYDDRLTGDAGDNVLSGLGGDDLLDGGAGNDTLDGGLNFDTATYAGAASGVTVNLTVSGAQNTVGAGIDTLISIENVTGSAFNDSLRGNTGANTLVGGAGDDVLEGGGGEDRLDGGTGNDTATYAHAAAAVSVNLNAGGTQPTGGAGTDTLVSIENVTGSAFNDSLRGNSVANVLDGGAGNDVILGGGGADIIVGGGGDDALTGGTGDDLFIFAAGFGHDAVADFVAGGAEDRLDFSAYAGSGVTYNLAQVGADAVFTFSDGSTVTLTGVTAANLHQIDPWGWG